MNVPIWGFAALLLWSEVVFAATSPLPSPQAAADINSNAAPITLQRYGARCDVAEVQDGFMLTTSDPFIFTSPSFVFTAINVGDKITVKGAGVQGITLISTISSVISTHVIKLQNSASKTVLSSRAYFGHTDDNAIQNALNSAGRNHLLAVQGLCGLATGITISQDFTTLETGVAGATGHTLGKNPNIADGFVWFGDARPMVEIAPNKTSGMQSITGITLSGFSLIGNEAASFGIQLLSVNQAWIADLYIEHTTAANFLIADTFQKIDNYSSQRIAVDRLISWSDGNFDGYGLVCTSAYGNGNCSFNRFNDNFFGHKNKAAIFLGDSDNNVFINTQIYRAPGGEAYGVIASGTAKVADAVARSTYFFGLSSPGGECSQGNEAPSICGNLGPALSTPVTTVNYLNLDSTNITPYPVLGTGANAPSFSTNTSFGIPGIYFSNLNPAGRAEIGAGTSANSFTGIQDNSAGEGGVSAWESSGVLVTNQPTLWIANPSANGAIKFMTGGISGKSNLRGEIDQSGAWSIGGPVSLTGSSPTIGTSDVLAANTAARSISIIAGNATGAGSASEGGSVVVTAGSSINGAAGTIALQSGTSESCASGLQTNPRGVLSCIVSSIRFKRPLGAITTKEALDFEARANPAIFIYRDPERYGAGEKDGLYAEDVCAINERLCQRGRDGSVLGYDERGVLGLLIKAQQATWWERLEWHLGLL